VNILSLYNTNFSSVIGTTILSAFEKNTTLKSLELTGNQLCSTVDGCDALLKLVQTSSTLEHLNLSQIALYDYGKVVDILKALTVSQNITSVNLFFIDLYSVDAVRTAVNEYLRDSHFLKHLILDSTGFGDFKEISLSILSNPMLYLYTLSINNIFLSTYSRKNTFTRIIEFSKCRIRVAHFNSGTDLPLFVGLTINELPENAK